MSSLKRNLRNSINGLLGRSTATMDSVLEESTEDIREAMLNVMRNDERFPHVIRRIRYASDIQALWYLRGDLMGALAAMHGEASARGTLESITAMFQGLLPGGMTSRPSPLR